MGAHDKNMLLWALSVTLALGNGAAVHPPHHSPRGLICYEDNQLRALERFSDQAKSFCPLYIESKSENLPQWLNGWSPKEIQSACLCFDKTAIAGATPSIYSATLATAASPAHGSGSVLTTGSPGLSALLGGHASFIPTTTTIADGAVQSSKSASAAASHQAPKSSASPATRSGSSISMPTGAGSGKRGLCYDYKTETGWSNYFAGSKHVTFGSNWGDSRAIGGNDLLAPDASFAYVPTIKVDSALNNNDWLTTVPALIKSGTKTLFASNEPDNAGQANLTPSQAASVYKKYMQPFKGQAALGTPAITNGGGSAGLKYLENFLASCTDCTFDFINVHYYLQRSDVNTTQFAQAFKNYIDKDVPAVQAKYKQLEGLKIMIGEWWLWNASEDEGGDLMDDLLPYLDANDDVMGYQAFGGLWEGNFITSDGSGLTPAGQKYKS